MAAYSTKRKSPSYAPKPQVVVRPRVQKAAGGYYHVWPNGQKYFVPAGGHAQTQAVATPPTQSAASKGTAGAAATSALMGATQADPYGAYKAGTYTPDSEAFASIAASQFGAGTQLGDIDEDRRLDRGNVDEALRRLAGNQKKSEVSTARSRNQQGLFYSGVLNNDLSEIAKEYARQRADTEYGYSTREQARIAMRHAIEAGASVEEAAAIGASVDRDIGRDTDAADTDSLVANTTIPRKKKPYVRKGVITRGKYKGLKMPRKR